MAIAAANDGHARSYSADPVTAHAEALFREHFDAHAETVFTVTGTAANVIALAALARSVETVLCAGSAHIFADSSNSAHSHGRSPPLQRQNIGVHHCRPALGGVTSPRSHDSSSEHWRSNYADSRFTMVL
ncbi:beta-eliminating lyase-related protein [Dactylosporangium sp. NPDC005572]|uniref:beta-eliminating lyase-related protein n=1 Tax=Dactylosporangium sp. NPDC005572 TaxID=3156889 RepID=UPI0033AF9BAC